MDILDNANYLKEGPPRKVSFFSAIKVLFDDYTVLVGAGILTVGLFFTQLSVGQSKFMELINISGDWEQTNGRLINYSMHGSNESGDFYRYSFEITVGGKLYQGTSYGAMPQDGVKEGMPEECLVEYRASNPRRSRIVGTSAELYPVLAACFLLLPLLGLVILLIGLKKNVRALYLLKYGILSQGKTISTKPVAAIKGERAYKFVFEFDVNNKTYEASCLTKEKERVEDDELYNILYKENNPSNNIVYDALGHIPEMGKLGEIKQGNPASKFYLGLIFIGLISNIYLYWAWYW